MKINRNSWHYKMRENWHKRNDRESIIEMDITLWEYWTDVFCSFVDRKGSADKFVGKGKKIKFVGEVKKKK